MIDLRLRALELAVQKGESDPVQAAGRYLSFLQGAPASERPAGTPSKSAEYTLGLLAAASQSGGADGHLLQQPAEAA